MEELGVPQEGRGSAARTTVHAAARGHDPTILGHARAEQRSKARPSGAREVQGTRDGVLAPANRFGVL